MNTSPYPLYEVRDIADIKDMLAQSISLYGQKPAFLVKKKSGGPYTPVTYAELGNDVEALGTAFLSLGLADKKIAVIGENRYEWAISYLAAVTGKSTVVPLDKELPAEDIGNLLTRADVSCIVYSGKLADTVLKLCGELSNPPVLVNMDLAADNDFERSLQALMKLGAELAANGNTEFRDAKIAPEQPQILLFTSGTTDIPKGVMLSHTNIVTDLKAMCQMIYIDDHDIFLSVLPLHHTYECTCGFLCALYRGCTIAHCEGLKHILQNMKEAGATMMLGVPAMFELMYKRLWATAKKNGLEKKLRLGLKVSAVLGALHIDVRKKLFQQIHDTLGGNVRLFISGAAAIDPAVSKGFRNFGISFLQGYGITECAPIVAVNRDKAYQDSAAGLAMPCLDLNIADKDADGIGEIVCRGKNVMLGYYQNEEATKQVFENGWFHTGDLGYLDPDGFLHITGRKKNVIVTKNGKNIFPEELETLLGRNPYVLESMIVGEFEPSDGETYLRAQIVPNFEHIRDAHGELSAEEIQKLMEQAVKEVNDRNPLYKYIRRVTVREKEFEKTTTKKIQRYKAANQ